MKKLFRLFVCVLLLGGWALAAASLHLVRSTGPIPKVGMLHVLPKTNLSYRECWVDTTKWTADDLNNHREMVDRITSAGKTDWLKDVPGSAVAKK